MNKTITEEQFMEGRKEYPLLNRLYQHYKGGVYEVMHIATDADTKKDVVVYKSQHRGTIYIRPLEDWFDIIEVEDNPGLTQVRFQLI